MPKGTDSFDRYLADVALFKPACNGAGAHRWGAARFNGREWVSDSRGRVIRVASHAAAVKLAERANREMKQCP
jgi:hypothetical protein